MSREIKFRAFWADSFLYHDLHGDNCDLKLAELKEALIYGREFQQFTGLKDRNGVDIYEGDIVREWCGFKGHVNWYDDQACFYITGIPHGGSHFERQDEEYEVIGNIHQNPELLEVKL